MQFANGFVVQRIRTKQCAKLRANAGVNADGKVLLLEEKTSYITMYLLSQVKSIRLIFH